MGKYARNRIVLEFNLSKEEENILWEKLQKFSHPAYIVKDILTGALPIQLITQKEIIMSVTNSKEEEDDDDLFAEL